ncbi:MAG: hypothetical protein DMG39_28615 [Acidobacteria bacterium]|nr:MAG: hypothetical protein DMG39_28615 [Acidobacteriota bacterium]
MVGSRCGPFEKAMALLRAGKVDLQPLITRAFPLPEAAEGILFAQRPEVMKVILKPSEKKKMPHGQRGTEGAEQGHETGVS